MLKHVDRHISAQRDILAAAEIEKIKVARDELRGAPPSDQS